MADRQTFLPEALYTHSTFSSDLTLFSAVVGTPIRFDLSTRELIVRLDVGLYGIIPEEEITIYDFTYPESSIIPHQISSLIGKRIRAIILGIRKDGNYLLSRKRSMLQAWETLHTDEIVNARIINVVPYGIFVDLGNGINSLVPICNCSYARYRNLLNWFKPGDYTPVKITSKDDDKYFITVSRKDAFPNLNNSPYAVVEGEILTVKISGKMEGLVGGYFCEYTPGIIGIINTYNKYKEGDIVKGFVKRITPKGLKLTLIE